MRQFYLMVVLVMAACLSNCGKQTESSSSPKEPKASITESGPSDGIKVVTTLFPLFDFIREVGGDKVHVKLLLPPGLEPHAYEPGTRDIVAISKADLFVYTGEAMEPWARRVQRSLDASIRVIDTSKGVTLLKHAEDDAHGHATDHACAACSGSKADPHIWLDFDNAGIMVDTIARGLAEKDPDNSDYYLKNAATYKGKLKELDTQIKTALSMCKHKTIISGGHFAFAYFAKRYGLTHESPYEGFSPDAEPSPQAIGGLIQRMKTSGARAIFYEEMLEPSVARVISEETGAKLLLLHGAHNLSSDELTRGETFLSIMTANLERLKDGLEYTAP